MRERLVDFLREQRGYYTISIGGSPRILREDGSIAAQYQNGKWTTFPAEDEIIGFSLYTGRGFPTKLCVCDYTNLGYTAMSKRIKKY